ncbi:hypothetical protein ASD8599_02091 [Ascidiaceihabitans donghaensis]|uniref:SnoaL-like domain-containing protein n=1 Tax=Ascidiaceihabitans donghaensis TaxID=1510460 RepID=A0A2R8BE40_9RHOB|nr:nuclear transport factor 2 family protein [Ascidiaceihabitans donghaensis]SPH21339.1 hypothetical protein ASD8599_02091 [Ascidiaceihabitans donghaensis]
MFQDAKACVRAHYAALSKADPNTVAGVLAQTMTPDATWRGFHPFNDQSGPQDVAATFWAPFLTAMSRVQRREDIFFAGDNMIEGHQGQWVVSMGHLMGLFDAPFLGIPPTGKIAMLRYAEFNKVEDGKITDTAFYCDLLHLMAQAGVYPLPPQTGAELVQPGPMTHDGLQFDDAAPKDGAKTLEIIENMMDSINRANSLEHPPTPQEELAMDWHDDMLWWGPTGIGATYTIDRYIRQHQQPFRTQTENRQFYGHLCRIAEGHYGAFFGRPNLSITPIGGYLGMPASHVPCDMRVIDVYRRDGDKLAENWIFIDMLHFLKMQGLDVLQRMDSLRI